MEQNIKPFFSVLIPAWNVEKYLGDCLDSILCQNFKNFEIIICDDASTDNTLKVIEEYEKKDSRIRHIVHNQNRSAMTSRNDLIRTAKGDYITFVDGDDIICNKKIFDYVFNILINEDFDITTLPFKTTQMFYYQPKLKNISVVGDKVFTLYLEKYFTPNPIARFYKRGLLLKSLLEDCTCCSCDDLLLVIPAFYNAKKVKFLSKPIMYCYIFGRGGWKRMSYSIDKFARMCSGAEMAYSKLTLWIKQNKLSHDDELLVMQKIQCTFFNIYSLIQFCQDKKACKEIFFDAVPKEVLPKVFGGDGEFYVLSQNTPLIDAIKAFKMFIIIFTKRWMKRIFN